MFMGDVGALPIGALLGWAFMEVGRPSAHVPYNLNLIAATLVSLVFVAELVPVPLQILSVKLRKGKRLLPRTPIHHAFQHAGWPETRVVWTFHLVQAVLVAVGIGILWRAVG
jgi:phospho-N-acetylmuramoyl-pentapeptide-transferase